MRLIDADELLCLYNLSAIDEMGDFGLGCLEVIDDIKAAPTIEVPTWIPVTERLPEVSGKVLCAYNGKSRVLTYWRTSQTFEYSGKPLAVTHWMPLPTPPKDGDT